MFHMVFGEDFVGLHIDELLQDADKYRLAAQVARPGRPVRARIAGWLVALAERIEGRPRVAIAQAEA